MFLFQAPSHKYDGHGSHVTNVRFTHSDSYLLSLGGKDTCILQWRVKRSGAGDGRDHPTSSVPPSTSTGCLEPGSQIEKGIEWTKKNPKMTAKREYQVAQRTYHSA